MQDSWYQKILTYYQQIRDNQQKRNQFVQRCRYFSYISLVILIIASIYTSHKNSEDLDSLLIQSEKLNRDFQQLRLEIYTYTDNTIDQLNYFNNINQKLDNQSKTTNLQKFIKQIQEYEKLQSWSFSGSIASNTYFNYIELLRPYKNLDCLQKRFGDKHYGGYNLCSNIIKNSEALFNIGIQGNDNFGCELSTQAKITNLIFDKEDNKIPVCSSNQNKNKFKVTYIGEVSQVREGRIRYTSLKDLIDQNGYYKRHIIIKMDALGNQWQALSGLPISYLEYIDQIVMKIYHAQQNPQRYGILKILTDFFYVVNYFNNNCCCYNKQESGRYQLKSSIAQLTLVNKKLVDFLGKTEPIRNFRVNKLNQKYYYKLEDCQIDANS